MDLGLEHINWDAVDESLAGADAVNPGSPTSLRPKLSSPTVPSAADPSLNLAAGLEVIPVTPAEPELVFAKGADARPFPLHTLGPLASVVDVVARKTQAPAAIAAGSALGVVSLAVQGHADVQTMAGSAPVSLFVLTIAKSGERKSACDKMLGWAVNQHERQQDAEYRQAMSKYIAHDAAHTQIANRAKAAIRAGEAGVEAMEKVGPAPKKPLLPDRVMTEPTFEGMTKLYAEGNPSQAILSDEGGQFLGGHAMNAENRQKTLTAISKLWDGDAIKRTRGGDGSMTLRGRRLSLHLMVQPVVASGLLSDPLAIGQGFLPRMLICQPESNIGFREVDVYGAADELSPKDSCTLHEHEARILDILRRPMPALGSEGDEQGQELSLRTLPLSREAREALGMFAQKIERAQAPGCVLSDLTGTASKIAEQACRIELPPEFWTLT